MLNNRINLRIRDLREDSDLYQRHLADYLKVTQQTYSRYETGELWPSLITMAMLAEYYNTSVDYLMGLTDTREPYLRKVRKNRNYTLNALPSRRLKLL